MVCVLRTCGFVPPHWHFEGCGLQSLTLHPVGCCLQLLAALAVRRLFSDFFQGLRGFPYLLAASVRSGFTTSLRPDPWLIVSFELVSVLRFGSASELSPGCSAPCPSLGFTLAPSRHSLLTFCLPLRYLASGAPLKSRLGGFAFPPSQFRLPWGFSAP